jgi:hypothetical protein
MEIQSRKHFGSIRIIDLGQIKQQQIPRLDTKARSRE